MGSGGRGESYLYPDQDNGFILDDYPDDRHTEVDDPDHLGAINLKHTGTLPLVESLRLLALRQCGFLDADETDYLNGAYHHITRLLLRQQLADFRAGKAVSNYVHPDALSRRDTDILVDSFKAISRLRDRVRSEFTGDIF